MPGWPSSWNGKEVGGRTLLGCGVYPIKFSAKSGAAAVGGPAPGMAADPDAETGEVPQDLLDEVLYYFKARMMMATFPTEGPGDRISLYLTLYIQQMLKRLSPAMQEPVAEKDAMLVLTELAKEKIVGVGDAAYPFNAMYPAASSAEEKAEWNQYALQLRLELASRVHAAVFAHPEGKDRRGNKYWLVFGRQLFLGHAFEKIGT